MESNQPARVFNERIWRGWVDRESGKIFYNSKTGHEENKEMLKRRENPEVCSGMNCEVAHGKLGLELMAVSLRLGSSRILKAELPELVNVRACMWTDHPGSSALFSRGLCSCKISAWEPTTYHYNSSDLS
jgi:hypothetical protein